VVRGDARGCSREGRVGVEPTDYIRTGVNFAGAFQEALKVAGERVCSCGGEADGLDVFDGDPKITSGCDLV
jgi:hypothetical protein